MKVKRLLALFLSAAILAQGGAALAVSDDPELPDTHGTYGEFYDENDFEEAEVDHTAQTGECKSDISMSLSHRTYVYNGTVREPSVSIRDEAGERISSRYYTVSYAKGRKNVGSFRVTATFRGNRYIGKLSKTFSIIPKSTALRSLIASSRGFTARWKKQPTQTTGYQLQYASNSKFKSAKTITFVSNKTTSRKVTKLSAKKKYYVRVRTYKTVSGKRYYSKWSAVKSVVTGK